MRVAIILLWFVFAIGWALYESDPSCLLKRVGIGVAAEDGIGKSAWCDYKNAEGSLNLEHVLAGTAGAPLLAGLVLVIARLTISRSRKRRLQRD